MSGPFADEEVTPELRAELYSDAIAMGIPPHLASLLVNTIKDDLDEEQFAQWQARAVVAAAFTRLQQDGIRLVNRHGVDVTEWVVNRSLTEMAK